MSDKCNTPTHTPSPWKWYWREEDGVANCGVFSEKREGMAYAVARCPQYQKREQWTADARLIAAAPDMLNMLIAAHALLAGSQGSQQFEDQCGHMAEEIAAVIAQALQGDA